MRQNIPNDPPINPPANPRKNRAFPMVQFHFCKPITPICSISTLLLVVASLPYQHYNPFRFPVSETLPLMSYVQRRCVSYALRNCVRNCLPKVGTPQRINVLHCVDKVSFYERAADT